MKLKHIVTLILSIVAAFFLTRYWLYGAVPVTCSKVEIGPISEYVDVQAKTRLSKSYHITMPFAARIEPIKTEEGSRIAKGQLLARVSQVDIDNLMAEATAAVKRLEAEIRENANTSVQQAQVDQGEAFARSADQYAAGREAQVSMRKSELDYSNSRLERIRQMMTSNAITPDAQDLASANQSSASAALERDQQEHLASQSFREAAEYRPIQFRNEIAVKALHGVVLENAKTEAIARRKQVERQKELSVMESEIDGIVLTRHVSNECFLPAGAPLLELGSLDDIEVEAEVISQDAAGIRIGAAVDLYGPAVGTTPVAGTVRRIEPAAFTKTSSLGVEEQRVKVIVELPASRLQELVRQRNLGVGFQLRAKIYTNQKSQARVVPRFAVFRGASGHWQTYVVQNGRAILQDVTIGLKNDELAEIVDGLPDESVVIVAPDANVSDDVRVKPIVKESPTRVTADPKDQHGLRS